MAGALSVEEAGRCQVVRGLSTKLPVRLTMWERDLIRDETFCDPDFAKCAVVEGTGIRVELSLDEIEEIQGYVAARPTTRHIPNGGRSWIAYSTSCRCSWTPMMTRASETPGTANGTGACRMKLSRSGSVLRSHL